MSKGPRLLQILSTVQNCTLAALHHPVAIHDDHTLIICGVALDSLASADFLRAALAQVKHPPGTPVLCRLRDPSLLTEAQAKLAGATATLPRQASLGVLRSSILALMRAHAPSSVSEDVRTGVAPVGAVMKETS